MSGAFKAALVFSWAAMLFAAIAPGPAWAAPAKTFAMPGRLIAVGPNPCAIACRDLNDDGLVDMVTADRGLLADPRDERPANDELSVLIADKPLAYTRLTPTLKTGFGPFALDIANVDGLKWPDIIVANFHAVRHRDITVFLNIKTEGIFRPATFRIPDENLGYFRHRDGEGVPVFTRPGLTSVTVRDMTGNGLRDLLATGWSSDVVVFMAGHAEQHFPSRSSSVFRAPRAISALRTSTRTASPILPWYARRRGKSGSGAATGAAGSRKKSGSPRGATCPPPSVPRISTMTATWTWPPAIPTRRTALSSFTGTNPSPSPCRRR